MDMNRLDRVMRRVRGEEPAACPLNGDRERLMRLISGEEMSIKQYEQLRQHCSGRPRIQLTQLWTEECRHHRDLQAEYLARYGDTLPPSCSKLPAGEGGVLTSLGKLREQELTAAEEYRRCGREAEDHRLAMLFEKHAYEEERHARVLTELLHRGLR